MPLTAKPPQPGWCPAEAIGSRWLSPLSSALSSDTGRRQIADQQVADHSRFTGFEYTSGPLGQAPYPDHERGRGHHLS